MPEAGRSLPRVSTEELLNIREAQWAPRLRGVSLVAEQEFEERHVAQVALALGSYYRQTRATSFAARIFSRWPACAVVTMTHVAAREYERGTYWPSFAAAVKCSDEQGLRSHWGDGFQQALRHLDLASFDNLPLRLVGPIVMHAGIPTYCFADLLRLLVQRARIEPNLDAESFLTWATEQPTRMQSLDTPARQFLTHGTDFAQDLLTRCLELIDGLNEPEFDIDHIILPTRLRQRAQQLAESGELVVSHRSGTGRGAQTERPRITLHPWGGGVEVVLPGVADPRSDSVAWEIRADDVVTQVRSQTAWVGVAEAPPGARYTVGRPTRTVVARLAGTDEHFEFRLVNADAPWLVFSGAGRLLPAHAALPPEDLWVLYHADRPLVSDGTIRVVEDGLLPGGWSGWRLERVVLSGAAWLQLGAEHTRRHVRGFARPRVETGQPIAGLLTPYGSRIFAAHPTVWLPSRSGTAT